MLSRHRGNRCVLIKYMQKGFTFVELMIAMTLSALLIGGLISFFSSTIGSTGTTTGNIHMNQDLQTAMSFISDEVRNTGYWADSINSDSTTNPFGLSKPNSSTATNCVIYSYDENKDGSLDNNEKRGIRLNTTTKAIEYLENTTDTNCPDADWSSAQQLTDKNKIEITKLEFSLVEDCHNSTTDYADCSTASSGDLLLTTQKINITIEARLKSNNDIKRHVSREILLRNNMIKEKS